MIHRLRALILASACCWPLAAHASDTWVCNVHDQFTGDLIRLTVQGDTVVQSSKSSLDFDRMWKLPHAAFDFSFHVVQNDKKVLLATVLDNNGAWAETLILFKDSGVLLTTELKAKEQSGTTTRGECMR